MTYTVVNMEVSEHTFNEIKKKLEDAGYDQAIIDEGDTLNMNGIALVLTEEAIESQKILPKGVVVERTEATIEHGQMFWMVQVGTGIHHAQFKGNVSLNDSTKKAVAQLFEYFKSIGAKLHD